MLDPSLQSLPRPVAATPPPAASPPPSGCRLIEWRNWWWPTGASSVRHCHDQGPLQLGQSGLADHSTTPKQTIDLQNYRM